MANKKNIQQEFVSLVLASLTPLLGVLLLDWDVHAVMFIISWEIITLSAMLGWLFNYPVRSTAMAILLMILFAPAGFLFWVVLAETWGDGPRDTWGMVTDLATITWISLVFVTLHTLLTTRNKMEIARVRGASISSNDRILLRWLFSIFLPFGFLALLLVTWNSLNSWTLAAVLMLKLAVDTGFFLFEHRQKIRGQS
jgi:hypothetical protein